LKAATTAVAMSVGLPTASEADANPGLASRLGAARKDRERLRLRLTWNPGDAGLLRDLAAIDADLAALRRELSLESRDFMRWVDANNVYLTDERAFQRRLADLAPGTRYLGIMRVDIRVCT
jgi:hypothetical protein